MTRSPVELRRSPFVFLLAIALTVLALPVPKASAGDQVELTVTILRVSEVSCDEGLFAPCPDDWFAKVSIGDIEYDPTDHKDNPSPPDIRPYWSFTRSVDSDLGSVPVRIQIWDHEDSSKNDHLSSCGIDGPDIHIDVDLATGNWTGNTGSNTGYCAGSHVAVAFDVSLSGNGDIDGDGIPDSVERFGIRDANGNVTTDMAALGADPCRADIAVEIDWLQAPDHSHNPSPAAIQEVINAFDAAPLLAVTDCPYEGFPKGLSGVNLIVDVDSAITVDADEDLANWDIPKLDDQRRTDFDPDREPYFFYNIWAHTHDGSTSGGVCCSPRKGFMVTLGGWTPSPNGTIRAQSATFMHELGHNIGLGHGGDQVYEDGSAVNFKPNYLSVMNYRYSTTGIPDWDAWAGSGFAPSALTNVSSIDYSRKALDDLDETALDENRGIGDGNVAAFWLDPDQVLQAGDGRLSLDWNWSNNGTAPWQSQVSVDINGDRICVSPGDNRTLDTTPAGDDVIPVGSGRITGGPDGTLDTTPSGDDVARPAVIVAGPNGTLDTTPSGDDFDGGGMIFPGPDGTLDTTPSGDDVFLEADIARGPDRKLDTMPSGDDIIEDQVIATGADRDCDTTASGDDDQTRDKGWSQPDVLTGFNDWANVKFQAALSPDAGSTSPHSDPDPTFADAQLFIQEMIEAVNQPPVADAGGPYSSDEGTDVGLDATGSSDPDSDPLTYAWDFDDDGLFDDATGANSTFDLVGQDGVFPVAVKVTDEHGAFDVDETTVTVNNVTPTITNLSSDGPVDENSPVTVSGVVSDPGWLDSLTATVDWGDGSPLESISGALENVRPYATLTFEASHEYGDNGTFTAEVCAADDDTTTCSDIDLVVANVSPTAEIDQSDTVLVKEMPTFLAHAGEPVDFSGRSTDPGSDDLELSWNWDDGPPSPDVTTTYLVNPPDPDPLPSPSIQPRDVTDMKTHAFADACFYEISFLASDDDGGTSTDTANVVIVGNAELMRSAGYWQHQFRMKGNVDFEESTLQCYLDIVGLASQVFHEVRDASTLDKALEVLRVNMNSGDMVDLLDQQLLAAWLNFANGAVEFDELVDTDGDDIADTEFSTVMSNAEAVRLDPSTTRAELEEQKDILERINVAEEQAAPGPQ